MKGSKKLLIAQVVIATIAIVAMVFSLVGAVASHNAAAIFGWSTALMWCSIAIMGYNSNLQYEKLIDEHINKVYNRILKK